MMWLVFGALYGTFFALTDIWEEHLESYFGRLAFSAIGRLGVSAPAIGGFVVVAQMISAYGECKRPIIESVEIVYLRLLIIRHD